MKLSPDEALRLAVGEQARARAMTAIDQGGSLALLAINLRDAAEAYRIVSEEIAARAAAEARSAR